MQIERYLKIDRDEGTVTWHGKIIGLIEEREPGEIGQTVSLFVEAYDFRTNGFTAEETPDAETILEIEDVLAIGYSLKPRREEWPGRRGI
jgi:hypothetical protein